MSGEDKQSAFLSRKESMMLLFNNDNETMKLSTQMAYNCIDEYGNYVFPTDIIASEPNIAYGSADGFSYITRLLVDNE